MFSEKLSNLFSKLKYWTNFWQNNQKFVLKSSHSWVQTSGIVNIWSMVLRSHRFGVRKTVSQMQTTDTSFKEKKLQISRIIVDSIISKYIMHKDSIQRLSFDSYFVWSVDGLVLHHMSSHMRLPLALLVVPLKWILSEDLYLLQKNRLQWMAMNAKFQISKPCDSRTTSSSICWGQTTPLLSLKLQLNWFVRSNDN